jgi:hypothetical protein
VLRRHPHRIPVEPLAPDVVDDPAGVDLERQQRLAGVGGVRRVAGGVAVGLERLGDLADVDVVGGRELLEEALLGAVVVVA